MHHTALSGDAPTSSSLLQGVRAADADAWARLVHIYGPVIHRWCRRGNVPDDEVADVGQEVFRAIACGIAEFRRDKPTDSFTAWLRTITRYKVADY